MQVNVFPDFLSSGLWDAETNLSIDPLRIEGFQNSALYVALKYWHWTWEFCLTEGRLSPKAAAEWLADGEMLVANMNAQFEGIHKFNYLADLKEVTFSAEDENNARI